MENMEEKSNETSRRDEGVVRVAIEIEKVGRNMERMKMKRGRCGWESEEGVRVEARAVKQVEKWEGHNGGR